MGVSPQHIVGSSELHRVQGASPSGSVCTTSLGHETQERRRLGGGEGNS